MNAKTPRELVSAFKEFLSKKELSKDFYALCLATGSVAIEGFCWYREAAEIVDSAEAFKNVSGNILSRGEWTLRRPDIPRPLVVSWEERLGVYEDKGKWIPADILGIWATNIYPLIFSGFIEKEYATRR